MLSGAAGPPPPSARHGYRPVCFSELRWLPDAVGLAGLGSDVDVHGQPLPGTQNLVFFDAVPAEKIGHLDAETIGDEVKGVATPDRVI